MACELCNLTNGFNGNFLYQDQIEGLCATCSGLKKIIERYSELSSVFYVNDLYSFFATISPVVIGNQIRVDRTDDEPPYKSLIRDVTIGRGIRPGIYKGRKDIGELCKSVLSDLIDQFISTVNVNPLAYYVSTIAMLEYNLHVSYVFINWLTNDDFEHDSLDAFNKTVVDSLAVWREFSQDKFALIYSEWERHIAIDKQALQFGLEIISDQIYMGMNISSDVISLDLALNILRAILEIQNIRDQAMNEILSQQIVEVTNSGLVELHVIENFDSIFDDYTIQSVDYRLNTDAVPFDRDIVESIDKVCLKHMGITTGELKDLINGIMSKPWDSDKFLIGSLGMFSRLFSSILPEKSHQTDRIVEFISRDYKVTEEYIKSVGERKNRTLRKCLVPIYGQVCIAPVNVLLFSLIRLHHDIFARGAKNFSDDFHRDLEETYKQIDLEFEKKVQEKIMSELGINAKDIPQKIPNVSGKGYVSLPRQIDCILCYKGKIFILECKNFDLKYTAQSIGNMHNKLRAMKKDSFAYKMQANIEAIKANWGSVLQYIGVDEQEVIDSEPLGAIITRSFTLASVSRDTPYPVVVYDKLTRWIRKQTM